MFEYFSTHIWHVGTPDPAQLCDRHAVWRAARRRAESPGRPRNRCHRRPRERHLAGRRQQHGAPRAWPLYCANPAAECQRPRNSEHPRPRRSFRACVSANCRALPEAKRRWAGLPIRPRPIDCSAIRPFHLVGWSTGSPTGSAGGCAASARKRTTIAAMAHSDRGLPPGIVARPLHERDLDAALALSQEAGWNQVAADWKIFFELGSAICLTRDDGPPIATAATLPYSGDFAWISMVLVTAAERRQGLARWLLRHSVDDLLSRKLVPALDATPAGRTVYVGLGFQDSWTMHRLVARTVRTPTAEQNAETVRTLETRRLAASYRVRYGNLRSRSQRAATPPC